MTVTVNRLLVIVLEADLAMSLHNRLPETINEVPGIAFLELGQAVLVSRNKVSQSFERQARSGLAASKKTYGTVLPQHENRKQQ